MAKLIILLTLIFNIAFFQTKGQVLLDPSVFLLNTVNFAQTTGLRTPTSKIDEVDAKSDWFILLYKPLCLKCQKTIPKWNEFSKNIAKGVSNKPIKIGAIDCSVSIDLCSEFYIDGYPQAVFMPKDKNRNYKNFKGEYSADGFLRFINYQAPIVNKERRTFLSLFVQTFKYFTFGSLLIFLILGSFLIYFIYSIFKKDNFEQISNKTQSQAQQETQKQKI